MHTCLAFFGQHQCWVQGLFSSAPSHCVGVSEQQHLYPKCMKGIFSQPGFEKWITDSWASFYKCFFKSKIQEIICAKDKVLKVSTRNVLRRGPRVVLWWCQKSNTKAVTEVIVSLLAICKTEDFVVFPRVKLLLNYQENMQKLCYGQWNIFWFWLFGWVPIIYVCVYIYI